MWIKRNDNGSRPSPVRRWRTREALTMAVLAGTWAAGVLALWQLPT